MIKQSLVQAIPLKLQTPYYNLTNKYQGINHELILKNSKIMKANSTNAESMLVRQ